jgi:hypothetical protein
MQSTIKDQAQELIRINLNQLLKVQVIPSGDEVMEKNRLDYLMVLAKSSSFHNINFMLDNLQMTPEQSIFLKELKTEILN